MGLKHLRLLVPPNSRYQISISISNAISTAFENTEDSSTDIGVNLKDDTQTDDKSLKLTTEISELVNDFEKFNISDGTSRQKYHSNKNLESGNTCAVNELNDGTCTHLMINDNTNNIELARSISQVDQLSDNATEVGQSNEFMSSFQMVNPIDFTPEQINNEIQDHESEKILLAIETNESKPNIDNDSFVVTSDNTDNTEPLNTLFQAGKKPDEPAKISIEVDDIIKSSNNVEMHLEDYSIEQINENAESKNISETENIVCLTPEQEITHGIDDKSNQFTIENSLETHKKA